MKPVMTVMGSLILAGNLLLAVPVRQTNVVLRSAEQSEKEVRQGVAQILEQRGIEKATAQQMVAEHFGWYAQKLAPAFAHMTMLFPELGRDAIIEDMAGRVLHQEAFAFDDYDHLVAMLHRLKGVKLDASHYARLQHCVMLNRQLIRS